jgi:hypothetical protein
MSSQLFFALSFLVILGRFADFIVADHPKSSKGLFLPDSQVHPPYYHQFITTTSRLFEMMFRGRYIRGIGFLHCFLFSAFFVQGTILFSALFSEHAWPIASFHFPALWIVVGSFALVISNFIEDIASVVATRILLQWLVTAANVSRQRRSLDFSSATFPISTYTILSCFSYLDICYFTFC